MPHPIITSCQLRAARAMIKWRIADLSRLSDVSENTIRTMERGNGVPNVGLRTIGKLYECFVENGITFLPDDGENGPGVRYRHG